MPSIFSPSKPPRSASSSKRPRSPDPQGDSLPLPPNVKRPRAAAPQSTAGPVRDLGKERKLSAAQREQQKVEFKEKYCRAFPSWTFYFDLDHIEPDRGTAKALEAKIQQLGGGIEDFFSNEITHLITNQSNPATSGGDSTAEKENLHKRGALSGRNTANLKSPIRLRGRPEDTVHATGFDLVTKAVAFNIKIWTTAKLESVLTRCLEPSISTINSRSAAIINNPPTTGLQRSLSLLLQSERIHGTSERDPTQKRHDYRYFSRGSRFVLVEDIRQELATVAAFEYPLPKTRDPNAKPPWPVLHCHPCSRGPFIAYDDREKRRWEKTQQQDQEHENERVREKDKIMRAHAIKKRADAQLHAQKNGDLRRSVSMSNLQRRATLPATLPGVYVDLDADLDSAVPSGYLASGTGGGYMAASGNSVGITSTTGTTSTGVYNLRNVQLPSALSGRIKQQVITSRKFPTTAADKGSKAEIMGPPSCIPERKPLLRKSRSTNTLKLPKREEGTKPGYCESCRAKFEDFKAHIASRKHRKFAEDDAHFLQLDCVLARVQRRTRQEVEGEQNRREMRRQEHCKHISARYLSSPISEGLFCLEPIRDEDAEMET
ncbi:Dfp1/Him1, central region-domain-containing protein [Infundibulicybe gibba]|nr:Dfp1/Him1, central region-domain-containing protein [Infundibulicybe gibba]